MKLVSRWRFAATIGIAAVATACSVADSFHVDPAAIHASGYSAAVPTLCRSTLGSYALPKSFLRVEVQRTGEAAANLLTPTAVIRADKSRTFCLEHIFDPLADDQIRVIKTSGQADASYGTVAAGNGPEESGKGFKDYGTQLLQWVVSNTVDQSEYIARALVRTAFIGLSGKSDFTPLQQRSGGRADGPSTIALLEYDPFDPEESAVHNRRLRDLGYCLVLEGFTFDGSQMTVEQYCNAPRYMRSAFADAYIEYRSGPPPRIAGIAYRPRIKYPLSIYRNDNPKARGRWRLYQQEQIAFENIAPIVSIGITRSIFAARRVALQFEKGALKAMCLVKTSELQSAVAVPYEIAKSIVALPTAIFEVKIGNIANNTTLLGAERDVLIAQKQYLDFLTDPKKSTGAPTGNVVSPLDATKIPKPLAVSVPASEVATLDSLQSSVLLKICSNAPTVIGGTQ